MTAEEPAIARDSTVPPVETEGTGSSVTGAHLLGGRGTMLHAAASPAAEDDVLDELASVLHQHCGEACVCVDDARELLPIVRRMAADALNEAADALDTRAVELWNAYKSGPITDPRRASPHTEGESDGWENAATAVRARADALDASSPSRL